MFHGAGPGRPKGLRNKQTMEQRAFAEAVCYGLDGMGREAFIAFTAQRLFAGALPPSVEQLIYFYLLGKPVERVEVQDMTGSLGQLTPEQLEQRALQLAQLARQLPNEISSPLSERDEGTDSSVH